MDPRMMEIMQRLQQMPQLAQGMAMPGMGMPQMNAGTDGSYPLMDMIKARMSQAQGSPGRGPMPGNDMPSRSMNRGPMTDPRMSMMARKPVMGRPVKKTPMRNEAAGNTVASAFGR